MPSSRLTILLVPGLVLSLSGCLSFSGGGLAPASPGATSLAGGIIGKSAYAPQLSSGAIARAVEAEYQALQFGSVGEPIAWSGDGASGRVVPTQVYRVGSQDCRGYTQFLEGADPKGLAGTACRAGDGTWVMV
ncbi:hypothetical protein U0C82_08290 [Fulvimarina sp. 2208YS6-2-32]|uniref:Surface antigen domain-containing protein n=1 Tax=Fulvimarina uroteuthidis TaxID=3098149 RepID=A0ABU5I2E3_9HYPH|nr:hypothetical protein [Fulvimarina sp. 2208YS6-2-32]MDY8109143.1 hypothetical protein [Fulvimarina sp. 2208YS6-2-32]